MEKPLEPRTGWLWVKHLEESSALLSGSQERIHGDSSFVKHKTRGFLRVFSCHWAFPAVLSGLRTAMQRCWLLPAGAWLCVTTALSSHQNLPNPVGHRADKQRLLETISEETTRLSFILGPFLGMRVGVFGFPRAGLLCCVDFSRDTIPLERKVLS